ncbi:hypothetical protein C1637_20340 [Chryseobacterium lactis]|uniref:DUF4293 family protein n=1 Tax=Chryseobacterium lactis TaxID=1241981 RepID=A0A3G6RGV9_CHRLC|nr:DUF6326 family protein [Chryseobacterium lactis]AZA82701.1 hypothetical protein EG342_12820 [Chryseobacterium lactis]AZB03083.1 hypothetical protein EG341_03685 [Chryseobacterium lactis]PNW11777.1 hypothetical protein C1637_20340 [Chryseobacterium lactis]
MNTDFKTFENSPVNIKIILAGLWTSVTLCYLYGDYFELYTPGKTRGLVEGNNLLDSPFKLFTASIVLAIPAVMVFLSLILKPAINRFLNIVLGLLFTLIMVFIGVTSFSDWYLFYVFLAALECMITILIVRYAWKWKRTDL